MGSFWHLGPSVRVLGKLRKLCEFAKFLSFPMAHVFPVSETFCSIDLCKGQILLLSLSAAGHH